MPRKNLLTTLCLAASLLLCTLAGGAAYAEPTHTRLIAHGTDGSPVSLQEGRGRTSLLIFWSPESLSSRKGMAELQRFADTPEGKGVFLLAVSTLRDPVAVQAFMTARGLTFPNALRGDDDFGTIDEYRLPIAYVFDAEGRLLRHHAGLFNLKTLLGLIEPASPSVSSPASP